MWTRVAQLCYRTLELVNYDYFGIPYPTSLHLLPPYSLPTSSIITMLNSNQLLFFNFHKWEEIYCILSFCVWLAFASILYTFPSTFLQISGFHSFFSAWVVFYSVCIPYFLFLIIHSWTPTLIIYLGYCEYVYNEHGSIGISSMCWFHFLQMYNQNWDNWVNMVDRILVFWGTSTQFFIMANLHSYQQSIRVPFSPYPHNLLLLLSFLN